MNKKDVAFHVKCVEGGEVGAEDEISRFTL